MSKIVIGEVSTITCPCTVQYRWVIDNFWICCKDTGDALISPKFLMSLVDESRFWSQLWFYPKGIKEGVKDFYSLIVKIGLNQDDIVDVKLSINNNKGELVSRIFQEPLYVSERSLWGAEEFVNRNLIENKSRASNLCRDDKLTIVVAINTRTSKKCATIYQIRIPLSKLGNDYEKLVDNEEFSDFELTIGDKSFRAHKNILSKRSPVFAAMFKSEMKEKQENKVEIKDVRYEVCLEMLRYIYAERVNDIENIADELLATADKYCIDSLKGMCEESLSENVNADNVVEKLRIAYLHSAEMLKVTAIGFIVAHGADIVKKSEFQQLPSNIICDVLAAVFNKIK